ADALGEHVGQAGELDDRPHAAARDDPGAVGGRLEQHLAGAEPSRDLERDRAVHQRHVAHALLGRPDPLADRPADPPGLAWPEADTPRAVADHHERAEAEAPSALHDLRHAVDVDDLLLQLGAPIVHDPPGAAGTTWCHMSPFLGWPSELQAALARAVCDRAH